ncbi:hypothetical protein LXL04_028522 [Taraxacum kok-saghyz]
MLFVLMLPIGLTSKNNIVLYCVWFLSLLHELITIKGVRLKNNIYGCLEAFLMLLVNNLMLLLQIKMQLLKCHSSLTTAEEQGLWRDCGRPAPTEDPERNRLELDTLLRFCTTRKIASNDTHCVSSKDDIHYDTQMYVTETANSRNSRNNSNQQTAEIAETANILDDKYTNTATSTTMQRGERRDKYHVNPRDVDTVSSTICRLEALTTVHTNLPAKPLFQRPCSDLSGSLRPLSLSSEYGAHEAAIYVAGNSRVYTMPYLVLLRVLQDMPIVLEILFYL